MPLLDSSDYTAPWWLPSPHLETIVPSMFRKVDPVAYTRETIDTADGDFLDIDWLRGGHKQLAILSHGLEGNSRRHYMMGMARRFFVSGYDLLAWNCRSCGGRMNNALKLYHHAASYDFETVINHALSVHQYRNITLVGFSMGGSIMLKYLGEKGSATPSTISTAIAFSVPCDLGSSSRALDRPANAFYRKRFLKKLTVKLQAKALQFPGQLDTTGIESIISFTDFDNRFTAPIHGFRDAADFYSQGSANNYLPYVTVPTLIVNAKNDPMLPEACYPTAQAKQLANISLEIPARGGHAGFTLAGESINWMEKRALEFALQQTTA